MAELQGLCYRQAAWIAEQAYALLRDRPGTAHSNCTQGDCRELFHVAAAGLLRVQPAEPEAHNSAAELERWGGDEDAPSWCRWWQHAQRAISLAREQRRELALAYAAWQMVAAANVSAVGGDNVAASGLPPAAELRRVAAAAAREAQAALRRVQKLLPESATLSLLMRFEKTAAPVER